MWKKYVLSRNTLRSITLQSLTRDGHSRGMFVQSAAFVESNKKKPFCRDLHLRRREDRLHRASVQDEPGGAWPGGGCQGGKHLLRGIHKSLGRFDFVMANPPFNVSGVDKERIKDDPRFGLGKPKTDNANYLWIQIFYNTLNEAGRAGFCHGQLGRAHRDFTSEQIEFIANIVRLYRGEEPESVSGSGSLLKERFPDGRYVDIAGLCKVATAAEIEA